MAESWIKMRATVNQMDKNLRDENLSKYYFIKHYKALHYKGKNDVSIIFEVLIRHNEIGNRTIERNSPYTFDTLEKELADKVKEYDKECELINKLCEKNNDKEFDIITNIQNIENENYYTVARVIKEDKCVELHFNKGVPNIEYGIKVAEDEWENEVKENVDWFNLNLTDLEVLEHLNNEYDSHFEEKQIENNYDYDY